jgi:hypothetical protein
MKVTETFRISFKALGDRKVRTSLTILMVIVGSSLMVTLNGIVAGLGHLQQMFSIGSLQIYCLSQAFLQTILCKETTTAITAVRLHSLVRASYQFLR